MYGIPNQQMYNGYNPAFVQQQQQMAMGRGMPPQQPGGARGAPLPGQNGPQQPPPQGARPGSSGGAPNGTSPAMPRPAQPATQGRGMPPQQAAYPGRPPIPGQQPPRAPYRLNPSVRNGPGEDESAYMDMGMGQMPPMPAQPAPVLPGGLNLAMLAQQGTAEQKQIIGEALYPKVHEHEPKLAGKITGMLLEMDNSELLHLYPLIPNNQPVFGSQLTGQD
jgi:polyadenylate-binding protein